MGDPIHPVIEFRGFGFQYRAQAEPTLYDIDLTVYAGEKLAIVGPSGSGKSTLAHCLNGLAPQVYEGETTGILRVLGRDHRELNVYELSRRVGTVLQDPDGQFVGLTVAEDIAFRLENEGVPLPAMQTKVAAAADAVGIRALLDASPQALSGGQKQKATMAGALVEPVDILLFDEPLASLDPAAGRAAVELIDRLHRETGATVIIVEHRLEDVLHRDVDRVVVMEAGRIVAAAPPAELLCTETLARAGIREPLYLTALKYAGWEASPERRPERVETVRLDGFAERLGAWAESVAAPPPRETGETLLELQRVDFAYERGKPILKDVSFALRRGEKVCLAGRNGAGKSTITKLICGFLQPSAGRLLWNGEDMRSLTVRERAERIGYVMQNPNHMICKPFVYEEVAFGLRLRGAPPEEVESRVRSALRACGLDDVRAWPISALSFGQKKRVTIASVLALSPSVIILDEPTAGQDYRHYAEFMAFLERLNAQGTTLLMITHDMHLMLEHSDRTIVLSNGEKCADADPATVLSNEATVRAAGLRRTSLHELAERAGLPRPDEFARRFVAYDREVRRR